MPLSYPVARHGARVSRFRSSRLAAGAVIALAILSSIGNSPPAKAGEGLDGRLVRLAPDDLSVVAHGEEVYRSSCASCHGVDLAGQPDWRRRDAGGRLPAPPHDPTGHTWHHADDLLFEIVKYGPGAVIGDKDYDSAMPAYEGVLSDEDIVAALSYIVNSWPEKERAYQSEIDTAQAGSPRPGAPRFSLDSLFK